MIEVIGRLVGNYKKVCLAMGNKQLIFCNKKNNTELYMMLPCVGHEIYTLSIPKKT